jgi:predicted N-acetyltransferase YhbS
VITIRRMSPADVSLGMRLCEQAAWNQTEADWQRFLDLEPEGCFGAEFSGQPVGTVTTCVFDRVGWIGMLLVDAEFRGRGVGRELMQTAIGYLTSQGVGACRLDATPLGQPLYGKLGFTLQFPLARFGGTVSDVAEGAPPDPLTNQDLPAVCALDKATVGCDRSRLLARLHKEAHPGAYVVRMGHDVAGFVFVRAGTRATHIGPWIAVSPTSAQELLVGALHHLRGQPVFVDVPQPNQQAVALIQSAGLTPQRALMRMCRGQPIVERVDCLWAGSGPEKG